MFNIISELNTKWQNWALHLAKRGSRTQRGKTRKNTRDLGHGGRTARQSGGLPGYSMGSRTRKQPVQMKLMAE